LHVGLVCSPCAFRHDLRGSALWRAQVSAESAPAIFGVTIGRWAAIAAGIGGCAWVFKAGVTLATGDEPPVAFTAGLFFPFALLGLRSRMGPTGGRAARVGGALAALAAGCVVLALLVRLVGGQRVEPSEDEVTLLTPFITIAGLATVLALIVLGIAVRRTRALAPGYASLPLAMGISVVPLMAVGTALESISERLLEIPVALLGLGWIVLGIALWNSPAPMTART